MGRENDTTGRYLHVAPDYLANARKALEDLQEASLARPLGRWFQTAWPLTSVLAACWLPSGRGLPPIAKSLKSGAGEGTRTLDPNLGKVGVETHSMA
jgi:hypothetical protein